VTYAAATYFTPDSAIVAEQRRRGSTKKSKKDSKKKHHKRAHKHKTSRATSSDQAHSPSIPATLSSGNGNDDTDSLGSSVESSSTESGQDEEVGEEVLTQSELLLPDDVLTRTMRYKRTSFMLISPKH